MISSDDNLGCAHAPAPWHVTARDDVVLDELPEDLNTDVERDREGNIVEHSKTRGEVRKLTLVERNHATVFRGRQLAFFEAEDVIEGQSNRHGEIIDQAS